MNSQQPSARDPSDIQSNLTMRKKTSRPLKAMRKKVFMIRVYNFNSEKHEFEPDSIIAIDDVVGVERHCDDNGEHEERAHARRSFLDDRDFMIDGKHPLYAAVVARRNNNGYYVVGAIYQEELNKLKEEWKAFKRGEERKTRIPDDLMADFQEIIDCWDPEKGSTIAIVRIKPTTNLEEVKDACFNLIPRLKKNRKDSVCYKISIMQQLQAFMLLARVENSTVYKFCYHNVVLVTKQEALKIADAIDGFFKLVRTMGIFADFMEILPELGDEAFWEIVFKFQDFCRKSEGFDVRYDDTDVRVPPKFKDAERKA